MNVYICSLKCIYEAGFCWLDHDRNLRFLVIKFFRFVYSQGVCGLAREETACIELTKRRPSSLRFTRRQKEKMKELSYIMSIPVVRYDQDGRSCRITGVLNVDTRLKNACSIFRKDEKLLETFCLRLDDMGRYAALWM